MKAFTSTLKDSLPFLLTLGCIPPSPRPPRPPAPELQVLPAADAANFMKAYAAFNGTNTEADVIKYAGVLLSRKDLLAFIDRPDRYVCGSGC